MINKISLPAVFVLFFSALSYAGDGDLPAGQADRSVVSVNNVSITEREVQAAAAQKVPAFHKNISEKTAKKIQDEALESLIDNELIYQAAQKQAAIRDAEVQDAFENTRKGFKTGEDFAGALKKAGLSESDLRANIKRQMMIKKMLEIAVLQPSQVSEAEAREHYDNNRGKYNEPVKMKLREIFFEVPSNASADERAEKKKKAEMVMEKLRAGGDFGLLAWEYSEDKFKYKSGEIGFVHEGMLTPEIEKEVLGLRPKETTGIIDSIYGYYIFFLEEKTQARQPEFADVKEKLTKELREKREKKLRETFIAELRQKAEIKRF